MRAVATYITAVQFVRTIDVRTVAKRASYRGTIRFDFAHLEFRIRVPFWKLRAVRRAIRESIPVTTACRVRALSLREHFRVHEFRIYT